MTKMQHLSVFGLILFTTGIVWLIIIDWQIAIALGCIVGAKDIAEDVKKARQKRKQEAKND